MKKGNPKRRKRTKEERRLARRAEEKAAFERLARLTRLAGSPVVLAPEVACKTTPLMPYQEQARDVLVAGHQRRRMSPLSAALLLASLVPKK